MISATTRDAFGKITEAELKQAAQAWDENDGGAGAADLSPPRRRSASAAVHPAAVAGAAASGPPQSPYVPIVRSRSAFTSGTYDDNNSHNTAAAKKQRIMALAI